MKRIIVGGGYQVTNIGNAFYRNGIKYALEKALGTNYDVVLSCDKLDLSWRECIGKRNKCFDHTETFDCDYLVLSGPLLYSQYLNMWSNTFEQFKKRGVKIVFMSAGANAYDRREYEEVSRFLDKHRLYALLSRDFETYELYSSFFEKSYNGICCALYVNEYAPRRKMISKPYIIMNYDNGIEPKLIKSNDGNITFGGNSYNLKKSRIPFVYLGRRLQDSVDDYIIIRTVHSVFPDKYVTRSKSNNWFVSDEPLDYLNLYANASAVITNRVHAGVSSVSYGTPVYLTSKSPRANIFRRIQCDGVFKNLYKADSDLISMEKKNYEEAIRSIFI